MKRRNLLKNAFFWLLGASLSWPLFAFVQKKRYRPPREQRISKNLKCGEFVVEPEFVLFETGNGPVAISRTCTHLGCRINYLEDKKIFLCPCHQSRFSQQGKYISGPAKKDLGTYKVAKMEDGQGFIVYLPA